MEGRFLDLGIETKKPHHSETSIFWSSVHIIVKTPAAMISPRVARVAPSAYSYTHICGILYNRGFGVDASLSPPTP